MTFGTCDWVLLHVVHICFHFLKGLCASPGHCHRPKCDARGELTWKPQFSHTPVCKAEAIPAAGQALTPSVVRHAQALAAAHTVFTHLFGQSVRNYLRGESPAAAVPLHSPSPVPLVPPAHRCQHDVVHPQKMPKPGLVQADVARARYP